MILKLLDVSTVATASGESRYATLRHAGGLFRSLLIINPTAR